jgi:hypothetical protein
MQSVTQNAEIPLHSGKLKAIAPFAASAFLLGLAPAAQAEEADPGFELVSTSTVTLEEAMQQDRITTFAANDAIETYVTEQAAEGREVDPENVTAIEFEEPTTGEQVTAVWDDGLTPTRFDTATAQYSEGHEQVAYGVGVELDPAEAASSDVSTSSNFGVETEGMAEEGDACVRIEFTPDYATEPGTRENHVLVSCYEKYRSLEIETPDARDWAYYRYGNFTTAEPRFPEVVPEPRIVDFSLRTQPWEGNADEDVRRMTGFAPQTPSNDCNVGNQLQLTVGPASLTFPTLQCDNLRVDIKPNAGAYGLIFDGSETVQIANSYAMALEATAAGREVVMSDYAWAEVNYGGGSGPIWEDAYIWTDGGWTPWNDL